MKALKEISIAKLQSETQTIAKDQAATKKTVVSFGKKLDKIATSKATVATLQTDRFDKIEILLNKLPVALTPAQPKIRQANLNSNASQLSPPPYLPLGRSVGRSLTELQQLLGQHLDPKYKSPSLHSPQQLQNYPMERKGSYLNKMTKIQADSLLSCPRYCSPLRVPLEAPTSLLCFSLTTSSGTIVPIERAISMVTTACGNAELRPKKLDQQSCRSISEALLNSNSMCLRTHSLGTNRPVYRQAYNN